MTTALINPIHVSATAEAPTSDRLLLQPSRPWRTLCSQRDYVPVERDSWAARSPGTPNDASRLRGIESDPYAQFYIQLNPCFAEGEALLTWIPLDVANIAGALFRLFRVRSAR